MQCIVIAIVWRWERWRILHRAGLRLMTIMLIVTCTMCVQLFSIGSDGPSFALHRRSTEGFPNTVQLLVEFGALCNDGFSSQKSDLLLIRWNKPTRLLRGEIFTTCEALHTLLQSLRLLFPSQLCRCAQLRAMHSCRPRTSTAHLTRARPVGRVPTTVTNCAGHIHKHRYSIF